MQHGMKNKIEILVLYRMKIPTRNPHSCLPEVRRAKKIHALIGKKSEACTGEESFYLENGFGDNNLINEPDKSTKINIFY